MLLNEFAGHASALLSSSSSSQWLKSELVLIGTLTQSTSHMTPTNTGFAHIPPRCAHSLGQQLHHLFCRIGSVEFQPVIGGIPKCPVVSMMSLHVSQIGYNYYLYSISLASKANEIGLKILCRFIHSVNLIYMLLSTKHVGIGWSCNCSQQAQTAETASIHQYCPLDLTLWHRRCSHLNFADLKHMHLHNKVKGW